MTTFVACAACQQQIPKIAAKCQHCGVERTHRECYPEQYAHPLCGKEVKLANGVEGTVVRVIGSRFGQLAVLDSTDSAYLVNDCVPKS